MLMTGFKTAGQACITKTQIKKRICYKESKKRISFKERLKCGNVNTIKGNIESRIRVEKYLEKKQVKLYANGMTHVRSGQSCE